MMNGKQKMAGGFIFIILHPKGICIFAIQFFCMVLTGYIIRSYSTKKILQNLLFLLILVPAGMIIFNRCANQGMPTGGPKDSIPPFIVETLPPLRGLNFNGKDVRITFNEYIVSDKVSEELIISPPLTKKPSVRTKSRTLIVAFNEALKPDVTYSLDFKNSVVDNNENNPFVGLRLLFSTGSSVDTLRVAGVVKFAENLEPQEKVMVMLYSNLNDTAVIRSKPDYVARTDPRGLFLFDNVKSGTYRLYALNDANSNLQYDPGAEEFAFCDSLIVPSAEFTAQPDTLAIGADSLLIAGHTLFKPDPVYLRTFTEDFFEQFVDKSFRESRYKCNISFNESIKDTFNIRLLNREASEWYSLEYNPPMDSLTIWVTDTLVARYDTLKFELAYTQLDSVKQKFIKLDTLNLVYTEKERPDTRKKKKEGEIPEIPQFYLSNNLKASGFDLNTPLLITTPEPVKTVDFKKIHLSRQEDTIYTALKFNIKKDTSQWRTYLIDYPWEAGTGYQLEIDSTAFENIYGITSRKVKQQFKTQEDDYYGRIVLNLSSVQNRILAQLLENGKDEKVLEILSADKNGEVIFDYLAPSKYKVRIIFDANQNGKWDTGNFEKKLQPERVSYLPEIVKVRSNWDSRYEWDLKPDPTLRKVLIDKEEEELRLKKLKEQQKLEKDKERNAPVDSPDRQLMNPGQFRR
jgi:hypothetical protein